MTEKDIFYNSLFEPSKKKRKNSVSVMKMNTPLGEMIGIADEDYLYALGFPDREKVTKKISQILKEIDAEAVKGSTSILDRLKNELELYFAGNLKTFTVPLKFYGTDFQKQCWEGLTKIKYGETLSYGDLAVNIGRNTQHSRAVGSAAGANPIIILIPCHRLIAHNNNLGGFSSGINNKQWLLGHEDKFKNVKGIQ